MTLCLLAADAFEALPAFPSESVHLCLTDPPYFADRMTIARSEWNDSNIVDKLPPGMNFDRRQGSH